MVTDEGMDNHRAVHGSEVPQRSTQPISQTSSLSPYSSTPCHTRADSPLLCASSSVGELWVWDTAKRQVWPPHYGAMEGGAGGGGER